MELFETIKSLTPLIRGGIDRFKLGGSIVERFTKSLTLNRDDRIRSVHRINTARTAPHDQPCPVGHEQGFGSLPFFTENRGGKCQSLPDSSQTKHLKALIFHIRPII